MAVFRPMGSMGAETMSNHSITAKWPFDLNYSATEFESIREFEKTMKLWSHVLSHAKNSFKSFKNV